MQKRGKFVFSIGIFQLLIIITSVFAISFLLSENLVIAQSTTPVPPGAVSVIGGKNVVSFETVQALNPNGLWTTNPVTGEFAVGGNPTGFFNSAHPSFVNTGSSSGGITGAIGNLFSGNIWSGSSAVSGLISGLAWAAVAFTVVKLITSLLGVDKGMANALSYAATAGVFAET